MSLLFLIQSLPKPHLSSESGVTSSTGCCSSSCCCGRIVRMSDRGSCSAVRRAPHWGLGTATRYQLVWWKMIYDKYMTSIQAMDHQIPNKDCSYVMFRGTVYPRPCDANRLYMYSLQGPWFWVSIWPPNLSWLSGPWLSAGPPGLRLFGAHGCSRSRAGAVGTKLFGSWKLCVFVAVSHGESTLLIIQWHYP